MNDDYLIIKCLNIDKLSRNIAEFFETEILNDLHQDSSFGLKLKFTDLILDSFVKKNFYININEFIRYYVQRTIDDKSYVFEGYTDKFLNFRKLYIEYKKLNPETYNTIKDYYINYFKECEEKEFKKEFKDLKRKLKKYNFKVIPK